MKRTLTLAAAAILAAAPALAQNPVRSRTETQIPTGSQIRSEAQQAGRYLLLRELAAVVIPRDPLKPGHTYTVSMTADSMEYRWSFKIGGR